MPQKEAVTTANAPPPMPFLSQAIKCQGMVYCSGSVGMDPKTMKLVEGSVGDRTVWFPAFFTTSEQVFEGAGGVLDEGFE
jgi:enamine deaminase RidA (YjgF/YER057c/UK114 family)